MPVAGNPMGDTGVEAVVRMAATTPALTALHLSRASVYEGVVRCGRVDVTCAHVDAASGCEMTAAGAKCVASWVARNPPVEKLWMSGKLPCSELWVRLCG